MNVFADSLKLGLSLAVLAGVCIGGGVLVNNGRKWLKDLEANIDEALNLTGLFPEPKE
jgi:hypothetical protein